MKVVYFFRKFGFSIERVFDTVINEVNNQGIGICRKVLPQYRANFYSILSNIIFAYRHRGAINHITGDVHYLLLVFPKRSTILTIHDCVMMHKNVGFRKFLLKWIWLKIPVYRAKYVTAISDFTRDEIIKYTNCDPKKVFVIPNPVDSNIKFRPKEFLKKGTRVLHFTGISHKNTIRVIEAVSGLNVQLVIIGNITPEIQEKLLNSSVKPICISQLTDKEILEQYFLADIILFPSLFEGFGMPIIEGQASGRVVITSNLSPMKEVAGMGAYLIDPYDSGSIRQAILDLISNEKIREYLIECGFENIKRYAIKEIAPQYISLYEKI